jgi:Sulfatase-modifying factor enzyme 1
MRSAVRPTVVLLGVLVLGLISNPAHAQVLGPFTMQLAPFCNVIAFTVADQGLTFSLSGFDDNCGSATRLSASGNVFFNPNGSVGGGLSIIATGQAPSQVALTIDPAGPSGTWSDNTGSSGTLVFGVPSGSGAPRPVSVVSAGGCPPDSVRVGQTCIDKYEASVWEVPPGSVTLIQKIKAGTVTLAELQAGGAVQRGVMPNDYGPGCPDGGNGCVNVYAVSIAGVMPSGFPTWFQATAAARNAGKRLLLNVEWQAAALGTPDPGATPGAQDCNTNSGGPSPTGSRANCVSDVGVFDMVGNLYEWVADWVPLSTDCPAGLFDGDQNCLAGASTTQGPGVLFRGGSFLEGTNAGVFAVGAFRIPIDADQSLGFRAAR